MAVPVVAEHLAVISLYLDNATSIHAETSPAQTILSLFFVILDNIVNRTPAMIDKRKLSPGESKGDSVYDSPGNLGDTELRQKFVKI